MDNTKKGRPELPIEKRRINTYVGTTYEELNFIKKCGLKPKNVWYAGMQILMVMYSHGNETSSNYGNDYMALQDEKIKKLMEKIQDEATEG